MTNSNFDRVKAVIADKLGIDESAVVPGAHFVNDLGADSLETVELVMGLEDEFGVTISDEESEKIRTVQDALDLIEQKN